MPEVEYTFKFAYTEVVVRYTFDNAITTTDFITLIKNKARNDFQVRNDVDIDIVETGLNTDDYAAEMAPSVTPTTISFKNAYINRTPDNLSFYIRVKTYNNNVIRDFNNMVTRNL